MCRRESETVVMCLHACCRGAYTPWYLCSLRYPAHLPEALSSTALSQLKYPRGCLFADQSSASSSASCLHALKYCFVCCRDLQGVLDKGINSLAVVLKHSAIYPDHEQAVGKVAKELGFEQVGHVSICLPCLESPLPCKFF